MVLYISLMKFSQLESYTKLLILVNYPPNLTKCCKSAFKSKTAVKIYTEMPSCMLCELI